MPGRFSTSMGADHGWDRGPFLRQVRFDGSASAGHDFGNYWQSVGRIGADRSDADRFHYADATENPADGLLDGAAVFGVRKVEVCDVDRAAGVVSPMPRRGGNSEFFVSGRRCRSAVRR